MGEHKKEKRSKKVEEDVENVAMTDALVVKKEKKEKKEKRSGKKDKSGKKEKIVKPEESGTEEGPENKHKSEKKEKKDKKRKRTDEDEDETEPVAPVTNGESEKPAESAPKKKKSKKSSKDEVATENDSKTDKKKSKKPKTEETSAEAEASSKLSKKDKKSKKPKKTDDDDETAEPNGDSKPEVDGEQGEEAGTKSAKNSRFICFIGNLPYTATTNAIKAHFASLEPFEVRLLTHKDNPTKSKGVAFIEFETFDKMKTCLAKFHHSEFNDNVSPPRKINVELTAGGGGKKSDVRKDKIKAKNHKLNEERVRKMHEEEAAKLAKEKKKGEAKPEAKEVHNPEDDIHPSRRGWVPYKR